MKLWDRLLRGHSPESAAPEEALGRVRLLVANYERGMQFANILVEGLFSQGRAVGRRILSASFSDEKCTLVRPDCMELFAVEWAHARLAWLRWRARRFSDRDLARQAAELIDDLDDSVKEVLRPFHKGLPPFTDTYLQMEAYEKGETWGPAKTPAGPGIGLAACYQHAVAPRTNGKATVEGAEWFAIVELAQALCWDKNEDLEPLARQHLDLRQP